MQGKAKAPGRSTHFRLVDAQITNAPGPCAGHIESSMAAMHFVDVVAMRYEIRLFRLLRLLLIAMGNRLPSVDIAGPAGWPDHWDSCKRMPGDAEYRYTWRDGEPGSSRATGKGSNQQMPGHAIRLDRFGAVRSMTYTTSDLGVQSYVQGGAHLFNR